MSSAPSDGDGLLTIDELSKAASLSVRTTRYYATLGLLPPPERRERLALYSERHVAVLQLVRALQDHGFTLAAIQQYLERLPPDASAEDLAVQRVMLSPWSNARAETLSRADLDRRAGRRLSDDEVGWLLRIGSVTAEGEQFKTHPGIAVAIKLLDLDIPLSAVVEANDAIQRHMNSLADELTAIVRTQVLAPFRDEPRSESQKARFEQSLSELRRLTLEALVAAFQDASDKTILRALGQVDDGGRSDAGA